MKIITKPVNVFSVLLCLIFAFSPHAESQVVMQMGSTQSTIAPTTADSAGLLGLPFTESWEQGFSANKWILPSPDNNWIIDTIVGNPPPCARFWCQPYRVNFSQALTSDTMDVTPWTCASVWLDFDVKINSYNTLGDEVMKVELFRGGLWKQLIVFNDHYSTSWLHYHMQIDSARGQFCQIRFVVEGTNSADVSNWYLDNIKVYAECRPPRNLTGFDFGNQVHLSWQPPDCTTLSSTTTTQFIFDDGTWEDGWRMPAGNLGWFGNEFPVSASGVLQNVKLYFVDNGSGSPQTLSVDIFDSGHNLIGSSQPFSVTMVNTWIVVPLPPVPYYNNFFAMVKYSSLPGDAYFLSSDENGPWIQDDLAWNRNATGIWTKVSALGAAPGVFLCRATALVYSDDPLNGDSSSLTGYDIYRSWGPGPTYFSKINSVLVSGTEYYDVAPPGLGFNYKYFIKAIVMNLVTSTTLCVPTSDTIFPGYIGITDQEINRPEIFPNPANDRVTISAPGRIINVTLLNAKGIPVLKSDVPVNDRAIIDVFPLDAGIYLVKIITDAGIFSQKLQISRGRY